MRWLRKILIYWLERQKQADGHFPEDIFYASARIFGEACLELFIFRYTSGGNEQIYLLRRPIDDPYYPGLLHIPGTRKLPDDTDELQLRRIIAETELNIDWRDIDYRSSLTIKSPRGTEYADIRYIVIPCDSNDENFYYIDRLPDDLIDAHKELIHAR